ncbi:MAG TPA: sulfite oxidase [Chloroflexota bacterium]|nr:sulfite oxidase [Chloroflexota bacterium]
MATTYPGKSSDLISLGDGLNFSTPLMQVQSGTVVPAPLFFLRSNNPPPTMSADTWRLSVGGQVRTPLTISLDDLKALPTATREVWLECAGNSRKRWTPPGEGNQWDDQAISDARFSGVSLSTVLDQAGVDPSAIEVVTTGADADSFQRALPIDVARRQGVMLVWEMNGEPIPPPNGGPVRLIVPGWAGIASVKWPIRMELVDTPFQGYWNAERYIMVDGEGRIQGPVREMPVKSIIAWPTYGESIPAGAKTAFGFAWSGYAEIARVDVSTDGQHTWSSARLVHGDGPLAWTRWEFDWSPSPNASGTATIAVRAADTAGNVQPQQATWNKFGYQMNAIVEHPVQIS